MSDDPANTPEYRNIYIRSIPANLGNWVARLRKSSGRHTRIIVLDAILLLQAAISGPEEDLPAVVTHLRKIYQDKETPHGAA